MSKAGRSVKRMGRTQKLALKFQSTFGPRPTGKNMKATVRDGR